MKKALSLSLVLSFTALQLASAKSIIGIHNPVSVVGKHTLVVKHKQAGGGTSNDIYVALAAKMPIDSPYALLGGSSVHIAFDSSFNSNLNGPEDAQDINAGGTGGIGGASPPGNNAFSIFQDSTGTFLSIEGRQLPTVNDTVPLILQKPTATLYQLEIDATTFKGNGLSAYLYDRYLKKNTLIPDSGSHYNFTVNPANDSTFFNRFSIVFKSSTLSLNSISLSSILNESSVALNWKTIGESNLASFSVEKSVDGIKYSSLGSVAAKNVFAATYTFTDANVSLGNAYYRIKTISKSGLITYSAVSAITKGGAGAGFGVYPNPVVNKTVNLKFTQVAKGNYFVSIYNNLGKQVSTKQIQHAGGTATYNTNINAVLPTGLYKLSIYPALGGNAVYTTSVLVQN